MFTVLAQAEGQFEIRLHVPAHTLSREEARDLLRQVDDALQPLRQQARGGGEPYAGPAVRGDALRTGPRERA